MFIFAGCQQRPGPALSISDVDVFLPLPGTNAAVAYFQLVNHGNTTIRIERISSPQFGKVEMHETVINDGVARMRPTGPLQIAAQSTTTFEPGGKHVMLFQARDNLVVDTTVTLEIHYDEGGLIIIDARMQARSIP